MTGHEVRTDLLRYYAAFFRPGLVDLSSSNPPPVELPAIAAAVMAGQSLDYVPPRGAPALRAAIAARYEGLGPDNVVITAGASEALAALAFAHCRRGAPVAADRGVYPSFLAAARAVGAVIRPIGPVERASILAIICNPTAPGGRIVDITGFAQRALRVGAVPIADEVYRDLRATGPRIRSIADLTPRGVSVGGLSKPLGLGGLRIGWVASSDERVLRKVDRQVQLLSGGPSCLSVAAAEHAMATFDTALSHTLALVRVNTPAIAGELKAAGWRFQPAEAGLTVEAWPPFPVTPTMEVALNHAGYFLLPCDVYGTPGSFRISLLADPGALHRGLAILAGLAQGLAELPGSWAA